MKIEDVFRYLPTHIYNNGTTHRLILFPWKDGCGYSLEYEGLFHIECREWQPLYYLYETMYKKLLKTDFFVKKESNGRISLTTVAEDSTHQTFDEHRFGMKVK